MRIPSNGLLLATATGVSRRDTPASGPADLMAQPCGGARLMSEFSGPASGPYFLSTCEALLQSDLHNALPTCGALDVLAHGPMGLPPQSVGLLLSRPEASALDKNYAALLAGPAVADAEPFLACVRGAVLGAIQGRLQADAEQKARDTHAESSNDGLFFIFLLAVIVLVGAGGAASQQNGSR